MYNDRVVATTYDAAQHILCAHNVTGHLGAYKTHQKLSQKVYSISQDDVEELLPSCKICLVNRQTNTKGPLDPIIASRVFERIQIDLIDFRHEPDSRFK